MQWHRLDHMQTICTLLQTDNHTNTSSLSFFTGWMLFLPPNQQHQSTEGIEDADKRKLFFFLPDSVYYTHKLVLYAPLAVV